MATESSASGTSGLGVPKRQERRRTSVPRLLRSPQGLIGLLIIIVIAIAAIMGEVIAPYDPSSQDLAHRTEPPSRDHWLGTDQFGRDILSRIIVGSRISLMTGVVAVSLGTVLGIMIGLVAAFYGGRVEMGLMAVVDVLLGFRTYLIAILVVAILGTSVYTLMVAIGIAMFPEIARVIRSEVLSIRSREYVEAARAIGASNRRIMSRHILPQVMAPLVVIATFNIANAIIIEASLSFLGLGPSPPSPAWGLMISEGQRFVLSAPWLPAIPGVAIMLTVLSFNLLGDTIRDLRDPHLKNR